MADNGAETCSTNLNLVINIDLWTTNCALFLHSVREVPDSNPSRDTDYSEIFHGFSQKWVLEIFPGGKRWLLYRTEKPYHFHMTIVLQFWEPQPQGQFRPVQGLLCL